MSITIVNTWGLTTSNSYTSLTEANSLISMYVMNSAAWDTSDDTAKNKALLISTTNIDSQNWHGGRYYWNQNLQFPRIPPGGDRTSGVGGDATDDGAASYYSLLEFDEYSRKQAIRVKLAQSFQAVYILEQNTGKGRTDLHRDLQKKGISNWSKSGAGISESYSYQGVNNVISPESWDVLKFYKAPLTVVRGTAREWENE